MPIQHWFQHYFKPVLVLVKILVFPSQLTAWGGGGTILTIYMLTSFGFFFINLRNSSKPIGRALEVLNLNRLSLKPSTNSSGTTLNIIFSVTYYLELHNAISIYCASHILPTDVKLVVWTLQNIADLGQLTN